MNVPYKRGWWIKFMEVQTVVSFKVFCANFIIKWLSEHCGRQGFNRPNWPHWAPKSYVRGDDILYTNTSSHQYHIWINPVEHGSPRINTALCAIHGWKFREIQDTTLHLKEGSTPRKECNKTGYGSKVIRKRKFLGLGEVAIDLELISVEWKRWFMQQVAFSSRRWSKLVVDRFKTIATSWNLIFFFFCYRNRVNGVAFVDLFIVNNNEFDLRCDFWLFVLIDGSSFKQGKWINIFENMYYRKGWKNAVQYFLFWGKRKQSRFRNIYISLADPTSFVQPQSINKRPQLLYKII